MVSSLIRFYIHCLPFHLHLLDTLLNGNKIWARYEKTCHIPYENNRGADQPVHSHSLISAFVVRCLDTIIWITYTCLIQNFKTLASLSSWAIRFESYLVRNPRRQVFSWCGLFFGCQISFGREGGGGAGLIFTPAMAWHTQLSVHFLWLP